MNILLFNGGTSNKNTKLVVNTFKNICEQKGHTVLSLDGYFHDCINCGKCSEKGECCMNDDFTKVFRDNKFDAIIIGTPIYFFHMSAKAKAFLDRLYSVDLSGMIFGLICISGSPYYSGGTDLVVESMRRSCEYCDSFFAGVFQITTHDQYTGLISNNDEERLEDFLYGVEVTYNEIKES